MGKGDKKSRRGKIINRSYGVRRPKNSKSTVIVAKIPEPVPVAEEKVKVTKPVKPRTPKKKTE
jgi:30S ribosomal protein S31